MRVVRAVLCCVPGALALGLLVLCAVAIDRPGPPDPEAAARAAAMPAAAVPARRADAAAHTAAAPPIVPRTRWLAGAEIYHRDPVRYADRVDAVFLHHTDSPNGYDCADAPRIIRHLYAGQAGGREWDDIGYNFLVDRCGTVYEGRAGGVDRAVVGAHTQGFNQNTAGIAAIGTFTQGTPVPRAMTDAIAAVAAWKLGLSGADPRATVRLVSSNSLSRFATGTAAEFPAISGHRDGYETFCPGLALMAELPTIREQAARLQGRP
ncbi:peptidoglycan recognition protein family protein [Streptomyces sp. cg35]|uniref:peptidoglycan recognition protein family protein n=1 Tax=Streptomyces sp. cg35 TaxID=3421650 RepID=UPI003D16EF44